MYKKVDPKTDFQALEKGVIDFWNKEEIFKKSIEQREGAETFTFYDGPPTANGKPHIGHVLTRAIKDLIPRYRTMKGYQVLRKAGWDTHGLPVELEVEKQLGISGKPQIEEYGIGDFVKKCKESVWLYKGEWEEMSERVGFWADMENPYITYDPKYVESVWWSLKQIADKGLLYKGHKVMPYCPRCGTSLSSHEVAQGYKDVTETSVYVKFPVKGEKDTFFLAWTTTPWTLPSNVALVVNPVETYVKVEYEGQYLIMAEALVSTVLKDKAGEIVEKYKGQDLVGTDYEPVFPFAKPDKRANYVVSDDYVTLTDGTGIVHSAPAFGEDDYKTGQKYDLPYVNMVNTQGKFVEATGKYAGMFVKDADKMIIDDLRENGTLFAAVPYTHSYPFCWRCDTPLLYYACDTWFIKMTAVRDLLIKNNRSVNWMPDHIKDGRMGNFLENVIDWGLSRSRYWGTPLPVWECECGHFHVIGSFEELKSMAVNFPDEFDPHKPLVDEIRIVCPECGKEMKRVKDVIDCWYDSGSMSFAQWHYPFENKDIFKTHFPADFISEAIDQTRGWFYVQLAISTLIFGEAPFKNCIVLGHVQDKDGQKMSKHKGNVVDPWTVLNKQGADAIRWYFYANSAPWLPNRFSEEGLDEMTRKVIGTLWNTYSFYVLYADIDGFDPTKYTLDYNSLSFSDKWMISKLNSLIKEVDENMEQYKITESARAISDFIDILSNWYVRINRKRFWTSELTQDKINCYMTLYTSLRDLCLVMAPFTPFVTEEIYQNIVRTNDKSAPESIHLCDYPKFREEYANDSIFADMENVISVVEHGRACRNLCSIKKRQPLSTLYYVADFTVSDDGSEIIKDELNVKNVVKAESGADFVGYNFKPQLRTLGPRYGKALGAISAYLKQMDGSVAMAKLSSGGTIDFDANGTAVSLTIDDVLIETVKKEGFTASSDGGVTVALDTEVTQELLDEGFLRETISKIQNYRKDCGLEVTDRIDIWFDCSESQKAVYENSMSTILSEVLCDEIHFAKGGEFFDVKDINGDNVGIGISKK